MSETTATVPAPRRRDTRETLLFGGVYGAVLASSLVAALGEYGHTSRADRGEDALWLLVTAFASALAHGYAHIVAERGAHRRWENLRTLLDEWPLIAAVLPSVLVLAGAAWGWWPAGGVEGPAFLLNIALLFVLGVVTARGSGRSWVRSLLLGVADSLLGVVVVIANALIH
ncbi:hypothetical protein [Streptomyces griseus]|uniref:hypothetical protein n=1 Tax=Streptomyces griseus TaxID=1911 RepID=UPI0005620E44|nr:hypothetical protein [Streptomyces griseus]